MELPPAPGHNRSQKHMKNIILFCSLLALASCATAQKGPLDNTRNKPRVEPSPTVVTTGPRPASSEKFVYEQQPVYGQPTLIAPEQAQALIARFREAYPKLGSPRFLIYVNRELVDETSGLKLTARTEKTEATRGKIQSDIDADARAAGSTNPITITAGGNVTVGGATLPPGKGTVSADTEKVTNENRYRVQERSQATLADKQTVRDVERLFGRPLRTAGATLADQRVATQLIADKPIQSFTIPTEGEAARKDREALGQIADVVVEVLISSRNIVTVDTSGETVHSVPDIQATAIRLSDSRLIGQASASDILGKDRYAGRLARTFDVREIAEATALALMEDILLDVK
jgi:hypothetical protein